MKVLKLKSDFCKQYKRLADFTKRLYTVDDLKAFSMKDASIINQIVANKSIRNVELLVFATNCSDERCTDIIYGAKLCFEHIIDNEYALYGEYHWQDRPFCDSYLPDFSTETFHFIIDDIRSRQDTVYNEGRVLFVSNRVSGPFNGKTYNYFKYISREAMHKWKSNAGLIT